MVSAVDGVRSVGVLLIIEIRCGRDGLTMHLLPDPGLPTQAKAHQPKRGFDRWTLFAEVRLCCAVNQQRTSPERDEQSGDCKLAGLPC